MSQHHIPKLPSKEELRKLRSYWVDVNAGKVYNSKGEEVGHQMSNGYIYVQVGTRNLKRANIVWWTATDEWPDLALDHFNRVSTDDRLTNLRPATQRQNMLNGKRRDLVTSRV